MVTGGEYNTNIPSAGHTERSTIGSFHGLGVNIFVVKKF